jgi:transcriptional regulator GlxA family with amidase domain
MTKALTIGIIVFDGVRISEVTGPAEVFAIASTQDWFKGTRVLLIGVEEQPTILTGEGIRLTVDTIIAEDLAFDVLLVPGGNDINPLLQHERLNAFIQKHDATAAWIGSVCAGAFLLGKAGVLNGRQATTWRGGEERLQQQFPNIQVVHDQPVVLDKRRITANGGLVSYQAALVLLGQLTNVANARSVYARLGIEHLDSWAVIEATIAKRE